MGKTRFGRIHIKDGGKESGVSVADIAEHFDYG